MNVYSTALAAFLVSVTPSSAGVDAALAWGGTLHHVQGRDLLYVSKDDALCEWPLTEPAIVIGCQGKHGLGAVFAGTEDGRTFALNGMARQWLKLPPIDPLWKN